MKFKLSPIGTLSIICLVVIAVSLASSGIEFPGSKEDQKVIGIMADGKAIAEVKMLVPVTIEAMGTNINTSAQAGGKHTMQIKHGSVEIRPEKGNPFTITGELIYIYGYGKQSQKP